jgi:microcin C transport system ATP-binding protein
VLLTLLIFIGEAVRDAFDPGKAVYMTQPLLAIDNLSIAFRQQGRRTSSSASSPRRGETLALVGESGSGKSVSALSVLRLLPLRRSATPAAISAFTASCCTPMSDAARVRGNRIAMIFQDRWCRSIPCIRWKTAV